MAASVALPSTVSGFEPDPDTGLSPRVQKALFVARRLQERAAALQAMMTAGWDDDYPSLRDLVAQIISPGASDEARRLWADDMREMISPENLGSYRAVVDNLDITQLLPAVEAPCLVAHCRGDRMQPIEQGRMLAAGLPKARFVAYDSVNHLVPENDPVWPLLERDIQAFFASHAER